MINNLFFYVPTFKQNLCLYFIYQSNLIKVLIVFYVYKARQRRKTDRHFEYLMAAIF